MALSRLISSSIEKCHHFSSLLKKKNDFSRTPECQQALNDLKRYLSSLLLFLKPKEGEKLLVFIAFSEIAVSVVLIGEEEVTQFSVYYVSKILSVAEKRYPYLENLALALLVASRKLRPSL